MARHKVEFNKALILFAFLFTFSFFSIFNLNHYLNTESKHFSTTSSSTKDADGFLDFNEKKKEAVEANIITPQKKIPNQKEEKASSVVVESNKQQGADTDTTTTDSAAVVPNPDKKSNNVKKAGSRGRYAYSFVIGPIDENNTAYKGFLFNVLISVNLLRKLGSEADYLVYTQLSTNSTLTELPKEDARLLKALDIQVIMMEKPVHESFASLMYDKFLVLQQTQYKRVIYLDSDVIPVVNLDYWFHLSDPDVTTVPTILRPNMNYASRGSPCNGGMFLMHPEKGAWEQLVDIIETQREKGKKIPYPHFDWYEGWGRNFRKMHDHWEGTQTKEGKNWRFHGGHSDQGLWFYYTKYVRKDVSFVIGEKIQTWSNDVKDETNKDPVLLGEVTGELKKFTPKPLVYQDNCNRPGKNNFRCNPPYTDIAHFMGGDKPWQVGNKMHWFKGSDTRDLHAAHRLWYKELEDVNTKLNMGLDVANWNEKHADLMSKSPLGYMPMWWDNAQLILKHNNNSTEASANKDSAPAEESKR